MGATIFLYRKHFWEFEEGKPHRLGPKKEAEWRAALDPAGQKLLDHVLAGRFDAKDLAALHREHLLSLDWDALDSYWDAQIHLALGRYHPEVVTQASADIAALLLRLALDHATPEDGNSIALLRECQAWLADFPSPLPRATLAPRTRRLVNIGRAPLANETGWGLLFGAVQATAWTLWGWPRPPGDSTRPIDAPGPRIHNYLTESCQVFDRKLYDQAQALGLTLLRHRLEGHKKSLPMPRWLSIASTKSLAKERAKAAKALAKAAKKSAKRK